MNEPISSGGYVFPRQLDDGLPKGMGMNPGITRRDWLAGLAMGGLVASPSSAGDSMHPKTALEIARSAYHLADLMIRLSNEEAADIEAHALSHAG